MLYELDDEDIIIEIKGLMNTIDSFKDEVNIYCDLIKQLFLSTSGKN